jgi:GT2 family glycosyltransferase
MSSTRTAVVIASANRPDLLAEILRSCARQQGTEFRTVVSVPDQGSLPADRSLLDGVHVVTGSRGLAAQRNAALRAITGVDVVAFFDDDAVPRDDYVAQAIEFFERHPEVVGLTGRVLLDGKIRGEVPRDVAEAALASSARQPTSQAWRPSRELYGCNFAFRLDRAPALRFDERLPLYSWLEDHDFARRLMRYGILANYAGCIIVHRAAASGGRQAHLRLGYSQVMNSIYLAQKGSFPLWLSAQQIFRPVAKNVALSMIGPAKSWRRERLRGNVLAGRDAARGRIMPERIVDL